MTEGTTIIPTNEFQTPITREFLDTMPSDVQEQFLDFVENVPLIKWMISPDRPRAKDLPRDKFGRIVVDITHPHILENMDFFRPAARFFEENGCYTLLKPNPNPKSEYGKWYIEELRRCLEGYVRESDGEWVTGREYFYLNYSPIMLNRESEKTGLLNRVEGFPDFWEGIHYRYAYYEESRYAGEHSLELARRGASKSFSLASLMAHDLLIGENIDATTRRTVVLTAYLREYLADKDGTLSKFVPMIDFAAQHTSFPRLMTKRSPSEMLWTMGYKDANGNITGSRNSVMGLSVKNDEGKIRGKRGVILYEEFGNYPNFKEVWNNTRDSVKEGSRTFSQLIGVGTAGDKASDFAGLRTMLYNPRSFGVHPLDNVYDLNGKGPKEFSYFFPSYISRAGCMDKDGNSDVVKALREILMERWVVKQSGDAASLLSVTAQMPITPAEAILKVQSKMFPVVTLNERLRQIDENPRFYDDVYVGTLVDVGGKAEFRMTSDAPIRQWPLDNNSDPGALEIYEMPPSGTVPPNRYIIGCLTPGQLVTTDSGLKKVEDVTLEDKLLNKDGEFVSIVNLQRRHKDDEQVYSIRLCCSLNRTELTGNHPVFVATPERHYHGWQYHLKTGLPAVYYKYDFAFRRADELKVGDVVMSPVKYLEERPIPYEYWVREPKKGLKYIDNPLGNPKFWWIVGLVLGDGWCNGYQVSVAFNTKETQYISRFKNAVQEVFGRKVVLAKDRSSSAEYVFCSKQFCEFFTKWFGKHAEHKNVPEWVKYLPKFLKLYLLMGYLDSDGCCGKNNIEFVSISRKLLLDVQDVLLSLGIVSSVKVLRKAGMRMFGERLSHTKETYSLSFGRGGVEKLYRLLQGKDLKLRNFELRETANHAIPRCWLSDDGKYVFYKITEISSRKYTGTVYNFECDTHTYMCDHLPVHNCDPYDNDQAKSSDSLYSVIVFDLFSDRIVAEYTGRKPYADDNHEMVRLLCMFYNAKAMFEANRKGYYAYFARKHCTWMLADCPEYLRDRQLVKYSMFGSSAKGISVNSPLKNYGVELIRDWMNKLVEMEFIDENGEVSVRQVPNLYFIKGRALLLEAISYDPSDPHQNTDRISALSQVMLYREEFMVLYGGAQPQEDTGPEDDFFEQEYSRHALKEDPARYANELFDRVFGNGHNTK